MKVKSVRAVGRKPVYDLSVNSDDYDEQHYVLENGVITHNTGSYYSADNIYIIGRQQEKEGKEVTGYNFIINVEKSRHVREKAKIPVSVSHGGGISRWSGLLDIALDGGFVIKPSNGWYSRMFADTGEVEEKKWRAKETNTAEFWMPILKTTEFQEYIQSKYQVASGSIIQDDEIDSFIGDEDVQESIDQD